MVKTLAERFIGKSARFAAPQARSLGELTNDAIKSLRTATEGSFAQQREFFPEFFKQQAATLGQGEDIISRLLGPGGAGAERATTQAVRAAQAARGVALSPTSAIEEGLRVSQARTGELFQAFGLRQNLTGFSAQTPQALPQFSQLFQGAQQAESARLGQANVQAQANFERANSEQAARAKLLGLAVSGATGGFAGGGGFSGTNAAVGSGFLPGSFFQQGGGGGQGGGFGGFGGGFGGGGGVTTTQGGGGAGAPSGAFNFGGQSFGGGGFGNFDPFSGIGFGGPGTLSSGQRTQAGF